mgnify:CR=1 FL=1
MKFNSEADLQAEVAAWLQSEGHSVQQEVDAGGARVDILTQHYLIEVKPRLPPNALFQASGQLQTYAQRYPHHQKVIAGLMPSDRNRAVATAQRIQADEV